MSSGTGATTDEIATDLQEQVRDFRQENKELIEANQELVKREAELQRKLAARGELEKAVDLEVAAIKDVLRMVQKVFKEDFAAAHRRVPTRSLLLLPGSSICYRRDSHRSVLRDRTFRTATPT